MSSGERPRNSPSGTLRAMGVSVEAIRLAQAEIKILVLAALKEQTEGARADVSPEVMETIARKVEVRSRDSIADAILRSLQNDIGAKHSDPDKTPVQGLRRRATRGY